MRLLRHIKYGSYGNKENIVASYNSFWCDHTNAKYLSHIDLSTSAAVTMIDYYDGRTKNRQDHDEDSFTIIRSVNRTLLKLAG